MEGYLLPSRAGKLIFPPPSVDVYHIVLSYLSSTGAAGKYPDTLAPISNVSVVDGPNGYTATELPSMRIIKLNTIEPTRTGVQLIAQWDYTLPVSIDGTADILVVVQYVPFDCNQTSRLEDLTAGGVDQFAVMTSGVIVPIPRIRSTWASQNVTPQSPGQYIIYYQGQFELASRLTFGINVDELSLEGASVSATHMALIDIHITAKVQPSLYRARTSTR